MGWFGRLIGTESATDDLLDKDSGLIVKAGSAIGNLHYSDQEKAIASQVVRNWGINQLEALHPFKITQRILAFATSFLWVFTGLNILAMFWLQHPALKDLLAFAFSDYVLVPTGLVYGLYFAGGAIESFVNRKRT